MLRNHLKVALRHLRRNRSYALLNTGGLAIGLAACLLIALWVRHETSYDRFHENSGRLYRVVLDITNSAEEQNQTAVTQAVLGHTLMSGKSVPSVEKAVRFWPQPGLFRSGPDRQFYEDSDAFFLADSTALTAFSFPLRHGDRQTALDRPGSVVLSPAAAARYFPGDDNPVGRTLRRGQGDVLTVTGVLEAVPRTSQIRPDLLVSMSTEEEDDGKRGLWRNWSAVSPLNYVLLRENASPQAAQRQLNELIEAHAGDLLQRLDVSMRYTLEPLTSVHLRSDYGGPGAAGSLTNVRLFSLVALFILGLACVNYTNLATAESRRRAKEVGVRRTMGAGRGGVAAQFIIEAVLLALAAGLAALGLARALLPAFEQLAGVEIPFADGAALLMFAAAVLGTGLLAGGYPAFVLSGFRPADVLRGGAGLRGRGAQGVRRGLTALQFAVAIGLIAATAVVFLQLRHMQRQTLGFQKERMLILNFGGDEEVQGRLPAVKARLEKLPAVERVAASVDYPGDDGHSGAGGTLERANGQKQRADVQLYRVDSSYTSVYDMKFVAGRPMARAALPDSLRAYLLNETAARKYGYASPEAAVDQRAQFWGQPGRIVGVVSDFHASGLQEAVAPIALVEWPASASNLTLRLRKGTGAQQALDQIEAAWSEIAPERPFDYRFLDQAFDAQYRAERRFGRLFGIGAALAIFVACLGLFGLAAFAVEERTKEIGIRKTLGASAGSIVALLSKDFLLLVLAGFAVATPLAWWAMRRWLDGFAYRIELGPLVFAAAGGVALLVAALTVSTQALRAARANPAEALRDE